MIRIATLLACLPALLVCAAPHPLEGVTMTSETLDAEVADPTLAEMGEPRFQRYCASCHGADARGDGPVGRALQVPPPDLRRIATRRGGVFPGGEIAQKIDGRFEIAPHGPREMPVWGQAFGANVPAPGMGEAMARGEIVVLVEYLKSIQDSADAAAEGAQLRETMGEVFAAMQLLLPLSLSPEGFEDPDHREEVGRALALLDQSSARLSQHGGSRDAAFAHLARALAIDTRDLRLRYEGGHHNEARYLVQTLTETCVACHSRLPASSAPRSEAFVRKVEVAELPVEERAKLAYATRQFDTALDLYEEVLRDESFPAREIDFGGHLDDYLELAIRVQRVPARAAKALKAFEARADLAANLREEVRVWQVALAKIAATGEAGSPIQRARELVTTEGEGIESDRSRVVEHLEASGVLHRALDAPLPPDQRAEAYYLLGLIETRIGRTYWLSQAEAYLETSIRLAPGKPIAMDAYRLLDEYVVAGYSGSGGTHVPPDIQAKLDRLRFIADSASHPADSGS